EIHPLHLLAVAQCGVEQIDVIFIARHRGAPGVAQGQSAKGAISNPSRREPQGFCGQTGESGKCPAGSRCNRPYA
ncbi:MAG: hypothetical protein RLN80_05470, partial [Rhodospirillales bacterium]